MEKCCICNVVLQENDITAVLGQKGVEGKAEVGKRVHFHCRKCLTRDASNLQGRPKSTNSSGAHVVVRRSQAAAFNFSEHCIFCALPAKYHGRKRGHNVIPVRTADFQRSIAEAYALRHDEWAQTVKRRLEYARDLHAADAVYHNQCSVNFRTEMRYHNCTAARRAKGWLQEDDGK